MDNETSEKICYYTTLPKSINERADKSVIGRDDALTTTYTVQASKTAVRIYIKIQKT